MRLSEKIEKYRTDRPDEWTMDEFIRKSLLIESELSGARIEAERLAMFLYEKYYKEDAPEFKLLDSVPGVISQIDNMIAGKL